jgi:SAM-dependent methyltransferase
MRIHPQFGICLDAGSGIGPKRPAPGFSAYCDVIVPKPGDIVPENYHVAPLEDLSCFKDKTFDWVRSHHSIEHTMDPDKACREMIRVGKAGIISFPTMQADIMFGRKDHNWLVAVDRGRLLFIRKRNPSYGVPRAVTGCELNVNFTWQDHFDWQVVERQRQSKSRQPLGLKWSPFGKRMNT